MRRETAALLAAGAVVAATRAGATYNPSPTHPRTAAWYARLNKPSFTPPGPAFGIAWTVLDGLIGFAGYRLLTAPPSQRRGAALGLWSASVAGLAYWPFLFFGRKRLGASVAGVGAMLASAGGAIYAASRVDKLAAVSLAPLVAWLGFAGLLSEEIWRRN